MNSKIAAAILAFGTVVSAHVASPLERRSAMNRCAVPEPSAELLAQHNALTELENVRLAEDSEAFRAPISVDVYVHVVSARAADYISTQQVEDQVDYMNVAFNPYDVSFNLIDTDFTTNANWGAGNNEVAMKTALRQGSYSDLNLYFVDLPKLDGFSALGYCHFPEPNVSENSSTFIKDGCVIMAESVPGGTEAPYNLGGTAVHEIGHWFDLYHTFQDGCTGGDLVADTPAQSSPSSGCPTGRDSCPNHAGLDPIHNFMDYSDDACYEEFTAGQQTRLHSAWETYRQ